MKTNRVEQHRIKKSHKFFHIIDDLCLKSKLEELADNEDRSFSNYVVQILKEHVRSLEDKDKE